MIVVYVKYWFMRVFIFCFFFSSRRRHTRLVSDWSSDVCSSDLGHLLIREGEVILRSVLEFDQDGLSKADELRPERRIGRDLRVELANQVLEHLSHGHRPPNSSSLRFRDSASSRRAVSHEVRVCGGRVPFFLIHFSRNVIVSGSDE